MFGRREETCAGLSFFTFTSQLYQAVRGVPDSPLRRSPALLAVTLIIFESTQPTSIRHPQGGEVFDGSIFKPINFSLPNSQIRESIPTSEYLSQHMSPLDSTEKYDSMRIIISSSINHLQQVTIYHPHATASQANYCYSILRNKAGLMQPQFGR